MTDGRERAAALRPQSIACDGVREKIWVVGLALR